MPKLSIIIPFNNGKMYLDNCLKHISNIEFKDYEIILIDDFSEDDSEKIAKKYPKIRYFYTRKKTIGVGAARNLGIEKANGEYIMFLDVDDTIEKGLLKKLEKNMEQQIEIIKYKMKIISNKEINNNIKFEEGPSFDILTGKEAFNKLCFKDDYLDSPCLYLIKRSIFERTRLKFEKNVYHEDFGLIPLLIINAKSVVSTDVYGYNYFQSYNSIMRNNNYSKSKKKVEDKLFLYDKLNEKLNSMNLDKTTKLNLIEYYTNSILMGISGLKTKDKRIFKNIIKEKRLLNNLRIRNVKQLIKKIILIIWIYKK